MVCFLCGVNIQYLLSREISHAHSMTIDHIPLADDWLSRTESIYHQFPHPSFLPLDQFNHPIVYASTIIVHCTYQVDGTVFLFLSLIPQCNRMPCSKWRTSLYSEPVNTPTCLSVTHLFIYFPQAIGQLGGFLYLDYWYETVLWSKKFKLKTEL